MSYRIEKLSEACRFIYRQIDSPVAHLAVFVKCGTRHEGNFPEGISHFTEHMIFKGTHQRKMHHILSGLENTGCDVNAYTSKEEMVVHASFLEEYAQRITHLFSDIILNSFFPESEIEKERNVIDDEIASLMDSPADLVCDDFERLLYNGHPLYRDILGNTKSLKKIQRSNLLDFYRQRFLPSEKVIVYYGKKRYTSALKMIRQAFVERLQITEGEIPLHVHGISPRILFNQTKKIRTHQTHVVIGAPAYDMNNEKKNALTLLINILGGQAFNSRLNMIVREKYGLSYSIDAFCNIFTDNGYWSVCFSSDNHNVEKIISLIENELKKLRTQKVGSLQLHIAKKQMIGQTAVYLDSTMNDLISAGKVFLHSGKLPGFEEIRSTIESISSADLFEVANETMEPQNLNTLMYVPK